MRKHIIQKSLLMSICWLTTLSLGVAMFIVALLPERHLHEYPGIVDHVIKDGGHMLGFFVFVFFLQTSIVLSFGKGSIVKCFSLGAGLILAGLTEILQHYSSGREPQPWDFGLDVMGTLIGVALAQKAYQLLTMKPGENDANHAT